MANISCASLLEDCLSFKLCLPFLEIFLERQSTSSNISKSLAFLEEQGEEYQSLIDSGPLKDHIMSLKLGIRFLEILLDISSNQSLKMHIEYVLRYVVRPELHSLSNRSINGSLILDLDRAYTNLREQIKNAIIQPGTVLYDRIFPELYIREGDLRKINDFLVKISGDLSRYKGDTISPLMKEIKAIEEKLILLQVLLPYVADTGAHIAKENKKHLTPLVDLLDEVACLFYSCLVDKMDEEMTLVMKRGFCHLLEKVNVGEIYIVVLRASRLNLLDGLIKLLDANTSSVIYLNNQSVKLHDELKFLKNFLAELPHDLSGRSVASIEAMICKVIPFLSSCYDEDMKEHMAIEVNGAVSEVLDHIENIRTQVFEIKLDNYPKTDGLGFLDLFLGQLEELLKFGPQLIKNTEDEIKILHVEFDSLRSFLRIIEKKRHEHGELENLWTSIINLAYQVENVIDFHLILKAPISFIRPSLSKTIEQAKFIKSEVTRIYDEENYHTQAYDVARTSSRVPSQATITTTDEIVGFEDEVEKIMETLVGEPKQRDVISIVGMPGLGKTTLVKKMYEAPIVVEQFHVRAWCCVSQTYQKRDLLLTILGDVTGVTDGMNMLNDEELAAKLYQCLRRRKYLIVIDDMWDIMAWNDLIRSFPEDNNHSRILITTRLQNVASGVGSKVHTIRQFSDDESWKLFQMKLFQKETFSEDFLKIGKEIAQRCNRLPLAIVVVAGLLAKVGKRMHEWNKIARSLSSHVLSDSEIQCKTIFELSYNHLPDHLKSCLLYFGAFAEDEEIPV